jgi:hypothetical protein
MKDAEGHGSNPRGMTPLTMKWRTAMRGVDRYFTDPARPANVKWQASLNTPERWERRRLAGMPGAKFEGGNLSNVEEMRARYPHLAEPPAAAAHQSGIHALGRKTL